MEFLIEFLRRESTKRVFILACIGLFLYLVRSVLNLFLLTFIFTYMMYSIQNYLIMRLKKIVRIKQKVMVVVLYLVLAGTVAFSLYKFIPVTIEETKEVINTAVEYYKKPHESPIAKYLITASKGLGLTDYADMGMSFLFRSLKHLGGWGLNALFSFVLSLFFLLEKNRIIRFTAKFKTSKLSGIYREIAFFGTKFLHSFGKVIEAQILIALINSILSIIGLSIMGFPQVFALGIMIFLLGLIPVAGVLISLIPLSLIAFGMGGMIQVVYVLIMITLIHALESYVLNPKLMSDKTELPVFYIFIVLIVSEHFFGTWGLIIGIPVFMFVLDILDVNIVDADKTQR